MDPFPPVGHRGRSGRAASRRQVRASVPIQRGPRVLCSARCAWPPDPVGSMTVEHDVHGPVRLFEKWRDLISASGDQADRQPAEATETRRTTLPGNASRREARQGSCARAPPDVMQLRSFDPLVRRRPSAQAPPDFTRHAGNSRLFSTIFSRSDLLGDIDGNGLSLSGRLAGKTSSVK